jgi:hypothetical protein
MCNGMYGNVNKPTRMLRSAQEYSIGLLCYTIKGEVYCRGERAAVIQMEWNELMWLVVDEHLNGGGYG